VDRYSRVLAVCYLVREDLGRWIVRQGWALAFRRYSLDYVDTEGEAREAKRGIWQGKFEPPTDWRAAHHHH